MNFVSITFCLLLVSIGAALGAEVPDGFGISTKPQSISSCFNTLSFIGKIKFPGSLAKALSIKQDSRKFILLILQTESGRRFLEDHIFYYRDLPLSARAQSLFYRLIRRPLPENEIDLRTAETSEKAIFEFLGALNEWGEADAFLSAVVRIHSQFLVTMSQTPLSQLREILNQTVRSELKLIDPLGWAAFKSRWLRLISAPPPPLLVRKDPSTPLPTPTTVPISASPASVFSHYSVQPERVVAHYRDGSEVLIPVSKGARFVPHQFANGSVLMRLKEFGTRQVAKEGADAFFFPAAEFALLTPNGEALNLYWSRDDFKLFRWMFGATEERSVFGLEFGGVLADFVGGERELSPYVYLYQIDENGGSYRTMLKLPYRYGLVKVGRDAQRQKVAEEGLNHFHQNFRVEPMGPHRWTIFVADRALMQLTVDPVTGRVSPKAL